MKKTQIKRVFLMDGNTIRMVIPQDFLSTLSNEAILGAFYEVGRTVWIGHNLYHIVHQDGMIRHLRYEVSTVTQYEKSWYNLLIDTIRRL